MSSVVRSRFFRRVLERAAGLLTGNRGLTRVLAAVGAALQGRGHGLGGVTRDAGALLRMARAVAARRYRALPKRSFVAVVGALLYFLDPLDVVPDFVPLVGLADDAAVLLWVVSRVRRDLDAFLEWESGQGSVIDVEPVSSGGEITVGRPTS